MTKLLVGFDSAWTRTKAGALVGVLLDDDGTYRELGTPSVVNHQDAASLVLRRQATLAPANTLVLLDQSLIVNNTTGQRPVENIVASPVGRRSGGVQPSNTSRIDMFGSNAPLWGFLSQFGGAADPLALGGKTRVFETYPALTLIALEWTVPDGQRSAGRLPKYNPSRKTFRLSDWQHVCTKLATHLDARRLIGLADWIGAVGANSKPRKHDQDGLDACLCLLVAIHMAEQKDCLMVGNVQSGYIVVPRGMSLESELIARCTQTRRESEEWVRTFTCY